MKKIVSLLLTAAIAGTAAVMLTSCGEGEYPVEVANYVIEKQPENLVVLDAATADIITYMGYDRKFSARSNEVDQSELSAAPSVGSEENPDIDKITQYGADIVFANDKLSEKAADDLDAKGIKVIKLQSAQTKDDIMTNYETVGKILGGKNAGLKEGIDASKKFFDTLDKMKRDAESKSNSETLKTICYLYMKNGQIAELTSNSFGNTLMGYTNCVNIAVDSGANPDTINSIAGANPNYIFYDSDETINAVKANPTLKKLAALKNGTIAKIPLKSMQLPGKTAISTLQTMNDFIYPDKKATPDEAKASTTATQPTTKPAANTTQPATTKPAASQPAATQSATKADADVSSQYKIKLSGLSLKKTDDNSNVEAMQQRLSDLGYITDKSNITGYYGELTEDAVSKFQKKNGIKDTGTADNKTLTTMFKASAKKA